MRIISLLAVHERSKLSPPKNPQKLSPLAPAKQQSIPFLTLLMCTGVLLQHAGHYTTSYQSQMQTIREYIETNFVGQRPVLIGMLHLEVYA